MMDTSQIPLNNDEQRTRTTEVKPSQSVVGVLLVHGLNGSKRDMEELATHLASTGIITRNILLPGHGTHVNDMLPLGWPEWATAVKQELQLLKQSCDRVFLIGHSLGGALCLHAAAHEQVAGIVAICAPLYMHPHMLSLVRLVKRITPMLPTIREDVCDRAARRRYTRDVYRWTPMAPLESMLLYLPRLREELPRITAPALIMTSRYDHVVPARDGYAIYHLIGSEEKHIITFYRSYHLLMKDHDREEVFAKTLAFIQRHIPKNELHTTKVKIKP
ncbi:MAG: alpha/beta fold hydrolase [Chloroflexi bacterium]|nr:MAG: alpha/beta fold hydrolase [Chloroflexota bacterium]